MASHGNRCRRVPGAGRGAVSSDGSAQSQPDTRTVVVRLALRTLPAPYAIRERTYRKVLGDALGDQLNYYSELLDSYHFPDPSYQSDFEDYLVRKYGGRTIDLLIANGPDRGRSCGAVTGAAPVSTADRVHRPRCAAASSQIDRPYLSACHERVARFGAAGASRIHATRSSCAAHRRGMHGTKTSFARRCRRRREAWSSPSCADTPCPR